MKRKFGSEILILLVVALLAASGVSLGRNGAAPGGADASPAFVEAAGSEALAPLDPSGEEAPERESVEKRSRKRTPAPTASPKPGKKSSGKKTAAPTATPSPAPAIDRDKWYYTPEDVAAYLDAFGRLPGNYLTKSEAEDLGWDRSPGSLWDVAPGTCIGGDRFGNREGVVPDAPGRKWYECDVNYDGVRRGAERLLYSSDGLIYYTADHYNTATQLYPQDGKEDDGP